MQFDSLQYLIFLPAIVVLYYSVPSMWRWGLLLGASVYFYASAPSICVFPLILATLVSYLAGILMERCQDASMRQRYLVTALILLLGNLGFFKYANFMATSFTIAMSYFVVPVEISIQNYEFPMGISFYTFLTCGYLIDIYRRDYGAETKMGTLSLYILFFPKLLAGPIERSGNFLAQLRQKKDLDCNGVTSGMKLIAWGLFKKTVIANRAAFYVDTVYGSPADHAGWPLIFAFYLYAFQIYCDFSGYTDIAIGSARMMGYDLLENFRRPYLSSSIREFWRRWHISLTSWLRDYLYVPLGGNRVVKWRWHFNIMVVFLLSGIWHGPNWTFLLWGALHGLYYVLSEGIRPVMFKCKIRAILVRFPVMTELTGMFITFHLVVFAWIFFRADSITGAWQMIHYASHINGTLENAFRIIPWQIMSLLAFGLAVLFCVEIVQEQGVFQWIESSRLRWLLYYLLIMSLLLFAFTRADNDFIYGRF